MKLLVVMALVVGIVLIAATFSTLATEKGSVAVSPHQAELQLVLVAPKLKLRRTDQLNFLVTLTNSSQNDLYVLGAMEWGPSASLLFYLSDARGKEIEPLGVPDDITRVVLDDKTAFVKLRPNHFLGTHFFAPLNILNLDKPGRYALVVEYSPPLSATEVSVSPFWGKEKGPLRSNVLWIEVVR
jgi:hypothetical protein